MRLAPEFDPLLLSRIEDAGLNASAPPQQRWVDGWLLRTSPGKAKRARCINALAPGRWPLAERLRQCEAVFREAGLPMVVRITPFSQPTDLDEQLAALGLHRFDDTRVMVLASLARLDLTKRAVLPPGFTVESVTAGDFAEPLGAARGSLPAQRVAHAQRLQSSPIPGQCHVLRSPEGGTAAFGQFVREGDRVGLYDVFTLEAWRDRGIAGALCSHLLKAARAQGAVSAYLQVEADNHPARAVYHRLGFADGYGYHYRTLEPDAA